LAQEPGNQPGGHLSASLFVAEGIEKLFEELQLSWKMFFCGQK